jgi:hypothetical protein
MRIRSAILALAVAATAAGCATTQQPRSVAGGADCSGLDGAALAGLYAPDKVRKVEPTYRQVFLARAIQPRYVSGARIYVPAEPGMHEAYLERALSCRAASLRSQHATDPLAVEGVTDIDVRAVGPTMRISIMGVDRSAGRAIWDRARALHRQGDVSVEQLAAAADARAF